MRPDEVRGLIRYRLQEAEESLEDARYLLAGNRSLRGVINRTYYAMFYAVLALLQTTGHVPSKHSGVISLFDKDYVHQEIFPKECSKMLHRAFDLRQSVDYRVMKLPAKDEISFLIGQAAEFIGSVTDHLQQSNYL